MPRRAGSADLPLHQGRVPLWLSQRMTRLGAVIAEAIVHHYGRDEFLRRLAHPFWFQCFGAVMGMDWHSSGITTSVIGALKRGLAPLAGELGLHVCGGRGSHSRQTPNELTAIGNRVGFDGNALARASRLVAKVDSAAVQDGFDLYLHGFIVADDGKWAVVQQGMNGGSRTARRYHWLSTDLRSFVDEPHAAIDGANQGTIVNLGPAKVAEEAAALDALRQGRKPARSDQPPLPHLVMPPHHEVRPKDVMIRRLHGALAAATEVGPADFAELLLVPGVGPRTVRSLALVAEVVHGAPCRFDDPGRFSLAHGGKDRHPFAVPTLVLDRTITVLKTAVAAAKLGNEERLDAIRRLDAEARRLERTASGPSLREFVAEERRRSPEFGGRSVLGWETERIDSRPGRTSGRASPSGALRTRAPARRTAGAG